MTGPTKHEASEELVGCGVPCLLFLGIGGRREGVPITRGHDLEFLLRQGREVTNSQVSGKLSNHPYHSLESIVVFIVGHPIRLVIHTKCFEAGCDGKVFLIFVAKFGAKRFDHREEGDDIMIFTAFLETISTFKFGAESSGALAVNNTPGGSTL